MTKVFQLYNLSGQIVPLNLYVAIFIKWEYTVKKLTFFQAPTGMSLIKLSLDENNLVIPDKTFFHSVAYCEGRWEL